MPQTLVTTIDGQKWLYLFYATQRGGSPDYDYRYDRIRDAPQVVQKDGGSGTRARRSVSALPVGAARRGQVNARPDPVPLGRIGMVGLGFSLACFVRPSVPLSLLNSHRHTSAGTRSRDAL